MLYSYSRSVSNPNQSYPLQQSSQFLHQPIPERQNWSDLKIKDEPKIDEEEATTTKQSEPEHVQSIGLAYLPIGEKFDPSTTSFSHDELRPSPIIPKRKKVTFHYVTKGKKIVKFCLHLAKVSNSF